MDYSVEVMKIIEGAIKLDKDKVIAYTNLLSDKLENDGEIKLSQRFRKIINVQREKKGQLRETSIGDVLKVPIDQESRLPIADVVYPESEDNNVILNKNIDDEIKRFITYYENSDKLINEGFSSPNSILLYGPPGCGKSKLARYLSSIVKLPLVIVRLDGIISSFLGSTSKNIRAIFEYAQRVPCVLFLDEFDAIAKVRDDNNELGELKRVVNSLLQNIDGLKCGSLIIAASNHEHLLDPAVWRRFNFRLKVDYPDYFSRKLLIKNFLKNKYKEDSEELDIISAMFKGLSGAAIEEICTSALMDSIIKEEDLTMRCVANHFFNYIDLFKSINIENITEKELEKLKVTYLREIDSKIFSYACIGRIINRSKSHVSNLLK